MGSSAGTSGIGNEQAAFRSSLNNEGFGIEPAEGPEAIPAAWIPDTVMGAVGSTSGSEPTLTEARATGTKLPTRRLRARPEMN